MNALTRSTIVLVCVGFCAGGLIVTSQETSIRKNGTPEWFTSFGPESSYQFAASDLDKFNFGQLEGIIRADVFSKFPSARVEFGSVKVEHGALTMPVILFGPNRATQAFLYRLVPDKNSWKIAGAQRLWFVPRAHLLRGLQV